MSHKPDILLIHFAQYGKHTNSYKYCQYLNRYYNITYLCFDQNLKKIEDSTEVIYLKSRGSSILNIFKLIKSARVEIVKKPYRLVYIFYFKLCSLIKPFIKSSFLLDIRTGAIDKHWFRRWRLNSMIRVESIFFKHITIISKSLREKLKIDSEKSTLLPLGSDMLSSKEKRYGNLSLFYIGTLTGRDIHITVNGLSKFIDEYGAENIEIRYDIFGDGLREDVALLKQSIEDSGLEKIVTYHGRKAHSEIQYYFDRCNIGVSHIPITEYYDCQPPTKTFEYINSGMVCLATDTSENRVVINSDNGLLYDDNEDAFRDVLREFYKNRFEYKTEKIINSLIEYRWENIINNRLLPLIREIEKRRV